VVDTEVTHLTTVACWKLMKVSNIAAPFPRENVFHAETHRRHPNAFPLPVFGARIMNDARQ
jgi:hypothetical protein